MWDQRFSEKEFTYGKDPNDFLASIDLYGKSGKVICLAEGQGRNAVYLAQEGFDVKAVDLSSVGLQRAQELAQERGVQIQTEQADLATYEMPARSVDGIVSIFGHFSSPVRKYIHAQAVNALKPGGFMILEAYGKKQLQFKTGGPPVIELLYTLEELKKDFGEHLNYHIAREIEREVIEGKYHHGMAAVVQIYGVRK